MLCKALQFCLCAAPWFSVHCEPHRNTVLFFKPIQQVCCPQLTSAKIRRRAVIVIKVWTSEYRHRQLLVPTKRSHCQLNATDPCTLSQLHPPQHLSVPTGNIFYFFFTFHHRPHVSRHYLLGSGPTSYLPRKRSPLTAQGRAAPETSLGALEALHLKLKLKLSLSLWDGGWLATFSAVLCRGTQT